jgi:ATP-binding cassette subfamily G (WHITE) protein 2 (PDR)
MQPPAGDTCGRYLQSYANLTGGRIYNPEATADCQFCTASNADQFLSSVAISYDTRWRDYGIGFAYIVFNIFMAVLLYYLIRVRKSSGKSMGEKLAPVLGLFKKDPKKENLGAEKAKTPQDKNERILP